MRAGFLLLALGAAALLSGCGTNGGSGSATLDTAAHAALCDAVGAAGAGESEEARDAFFDGAHDQLHDLAARVEDEDRAAAARLLEAKAAVEAALERADDEGLAARLSELAAATAAGIAATGGDPPNSCG